MGDSQELAYKNRGKKLVHALPDELKEQMGRAIHPKVLWQQSLSLCTASSGVADRAAVEASGPTGD